MNSHYKFEDRVRLAQSARRETEPLVVVLRSLFTQTREGIDAEGERDDGDPGGPSPRFSLLLLSVFSVFRKVNRPRHPQTNSPSVNDGELDQEISGTVRRDVVWYRTVNSWT